jgi:hypothetical protein
MTFLDKLTVSYTARRMIPIFLVAGSFLYCVQTPSVLTRVHNDVD